MNQNQLAPVGTKQNLRKLLTGKAVMEQLVSVGSKYLPPDKVVKLALLASSHQPDLLKCTVPSLLRAVMDASQLGLDFGGGPTARAHIVPFRNKKLDCYLATLIPGYQGFIEIAYRTGRVKFIDAQLVYDRDECEYELGTKPFIRHRPFLAGDRGRLLFGYAIVLMIDSDIPKLEIMTAADLDAIRKRSRSGDAGPWRTDTAQMQRKTLIRRIVKFIPMSPELDRAVELDLPDDEQESQYRRQVLNTATAGVDPETGEVLDDYFDYHDAGCYIDTDPETPGAAGESQAEADEDFPDSGPEQGGPSLADRKSELVDTIAETLDQLHGEDRAARLRALKDIFGKVQLEEVKRLPLQILQAGLGMLQSEVSDAEAD